MATNKQKLVIKRISENVGTALSVSQAMRDVGYSDSYSANPQTLRRTKSFKDLLDKYLPEEDLTIVHKQLLDSKTLRVFRFPITLKKREINKFAYKFAAKEDVSIVKESIPHYKRGEVDWIDENWVVSCILPNSGTVLRAMDFAYKLRGSYEAEEIRVVDEYEQLSDSQIEDRILQLKKKRNVKPRRKQRVRKTAKATVKKTK